MTAPAEYEPARARPVGQTLRVPRAALARVRGAWLKGHGADLPHDSVPARWVRAIGLSALLDLIESDAGAPVREIDRRVAEIARRLQWKAR